VVNVAKKQVATNLLLVVLICALHMVVEKNAVMNHAQKVLNHLLVSVLDTEVVVSAKWKCVPK
jgi:hypothetical protein